MFPTRSLVYRLVLAALAMLLAACRSQTSSVPSTTNTPEPPTAAVSRLPSVTTTMTATATTANIPTATHSPSYTSTPTLPPTPTTTFTSTITPTPYPPERLAFAVGPQESPAIAFINSDGTGFDRADYFGSFMFVNNESQSHMTGDFLNFSPDGRYLAFDGSKDAGFASVYLVDLSQGKILGSIPNSRGYPFSWSPDSRYLVVSGYVYEQYSRNLILYDVEIGQSKQLTEGNAARYFPSWSPDGQWITFMQVNDSYPVYPCVDLGEGCDGLYIIHPDGSGLRFLTGDVAFSYMDFPYYFAWTPPWSPDSQWLSIITLSNHENVIINVNNGEIRGFDINNWDKMGWTPDGRLYTILSPSGNADIVTMLPDGSERTNLTKSPGNESAPSWSPSGHFVAFYYNYQEQNFLCVVNADGSNRHCFEGITGKRIAWLPVGHP